MNRVRQLYFPLGYPVALSSDSEAVHAAADESWPCREPLFDESPIAVAVHVAPGGRLAPNFAPYEVAFTGSPSGFRFVSGDTKFAEGDFRNRSAALYLDESTVRNRPYFRFHFLEAAVLQLISALHHAPIHAACVTPPSAMHPAGILLCGDSGAGKSSLTYACARAGWTFTSDDASFLIRDNDGPPTVVGDAGRMRLRPQSAMLFPELASRTATERGNGDQRLQILTKELPVKTSPQAAIAQVVLLNRDDLSPAQWAVWDRARAESWLDRVVYHWAPEIAATQRRALASLLDHARLRVLTYSRLEHAMDALRG